MGLLSVVFHPNFTSSGSIGENKMYIYYYTTGSSPAYTIISEWIVDRVTSQVSSTHIEKIVLRIRQPYGNHNGGTLLFGPHDGLLYLTVGID
jgi:quinoprotein glucose dehydrogenase